VIQLLAWLIIGSALDGGATQSAFTLASLLFWACASTLLAWRRDRASGIDLLFLRWGLLSFVLIGTPLLRPVVQTWDWLAMVLLPGAAILLVGCVFYLIARIFGLPSPFDELGLDSTVDDKRSPQV
jgi:hypothetical protein